MVRFEQIPARVEIVVRKIFLILGCVLLGAVLAVVASIATYTTYQPLILIGHFDQGKRPCFVKEDIIPYQGKQVPMVGLNCPMDHSYPSLYYSMYPRLGGPRNGDRYECRVFEHYVLYRFSVKSMYSFEYCVFKMRQEGT